MVMVFVNRPVNHLGLSDNIAGLVFECAQKTEKALKAGLSCQC